MPIREKAKSFFRRDRSNTKTSTSPSTLSKTSTVTSASAGSSDDAVPAKTTASAGTTTITTTTSAPTQPDRWPSHVYRPGEPMPRPKYRATPKKEHTAKLQAFSFADSWRKASYQSQYSPMGTRAPSRRNSSRLPSRRNSVFSVRAPHSGSVDGGGASEADPEGPVINVETVEAGGVAKPPRLSTEVERESEEEEEEEEEDEAKEQDDEGVPVVRAEAVPRVLSTAHDHTPFTEQDLTLALHRSHLMVPARS